MNVAITAIGSVRPVITVLRQLCRNRNTISTVRNPPSTIVCLTRSTARLDLVGGRIGDADLDVGRQPVLQRRDRRLHVAAGLDDVSVLRLLDVERDRRPAVDRARSSSSPSRRR